MLFHLAPDSLLRPLVTHWWSKGVGFKEIHRRLQDGNFWDKVQYDIGWVEE